MKRLWVILTFLILVQSDTFVSTEQQKSDWFNSLVEGTYIDGDNSTIIKVCDTATFTYGTGNETATLVITNGPGAIHINPTYISVFDGDK